MGFCNTGTILDKAMSKFADSTDTTLRALCLGWLNEIIRDIFDQPRTWEFLKASTSLAVTSNAITIPSGVGEIIGITVNDVYLTPDEQISEEFAQEEYSGITGATPEAYVLSGSTVTFYPGASGTALLLYETDVATDYADNVDTIFPHNLTNLLITGVRMHYYDYDKDGRYAKEVTLYQYEMKKVKAWDNRLKPLPEFNQHGYVRTES